MKIKKLIITLFLLFLFYSASVSNTVTARDTSKYYKTAAVPEEINKMYIPDFTYEKDGISHNFSDSRGKIVFINLWATWCSPCRKEMPDLIKLYDKYRGNNFEILGILVADKPENLDEYLIYNDINYKIIYGNDKLISAISRAIGQTIESIPFTIIVDENGRVTETFVGTRTYEVFESILKKFIN